MQAVTAFSESYEKHALKCLESFVEFWPCKVVAYYEARPLFSHPKIEYRSQLEIPGYSDFLEKIKRVAGSDGHGNNDFDYRFDAKTYCRKVFAQDSAFNDGGEVFWLDADTVTLQTVPEDFLKFLVEKHPFAYMGRIGKDAYTETGFLGFNTGHKKFPEFRSKYLSYFTTGRIFSQLKGWHDCIAFDYARQGIEGNNLSPTAKMGHVLMQTVLAPYIDHMKGPKRKVLGYSPEHPSHVPAVV